LVSLFESPLVLRAGGT